MAYCCSRYPNSSQDYENTYNEYSSNNEYYLKCAKFSNDLLNNFKIKVIGFYVKEDGTQMLYATKVLNPHQRYNVTQYINCQIDGDDYSLISI